MGVALHAALIAVHANDAETFEVRFLAWFTSDASVLIFLYQTLETLQTCIHDFTTFEEDCDAFVEREGGTLANHFQLFPAHLIQLSDIKELFRMLADLEPATMSSDPGWVEAVEDIEAWARRQLNHWKALEGEMDFDEFDWSQKLSA